MTIDDIIDGARVFLGDLHEDHYTDLDLNRALRSVVLGTVKNDINVEFSYATGAKDLSPVPTSDQGAIISLALTLAMIVGDRSGAMRDGTFMTFKSGLSSISLAGQERTFKDTIIDLTAKYTNQVGSYMTKQATGSVVDLYDITGSDIVGVN